ncbi:MAG: TIGR00266 family protein [Candidatus Micrarchaeaceae archaeon]
MKYEILGENMQAVKITLNKGEKIYADAGKLLSKENITMTPRMRGGIIGAITREVSGATAFVTEFEATEDTGEVTLTGTLPGKMLAIELNENESFIAEHYAFVAADDTVKFTVQTLNVSAALFGGAGFILQKFIGPGIVFLHVVGNIVEYNLDGSATLEVDPQHIAGFSDGLQYKIMFVDNIRSALFGGIGIFLAKFEGNGKVIIHSVSRYKLANELFGLGKEQQEK